MPTLANGEEWGDWRPDCLLSCLETSPQHACSSQPVHRRLRRSMPTYHYVPIEGTDLPPALGRPLAHRSSPSPCRTSGKTRSRSRVGRPDRRWRTTALTPTPSIRPHHGTPLVVPQGRPRRVRRRSSSPAVTPAAASSVATPTTRGYCGRTATCHASATARCSAFDDARCSRHTPRYGSSSTANIFDQGGYLPDSI